MTDLGSKVLTPKGSLRGSVHSFGSDASKLLFSLNVTQRNALLMKYASLGEEYQTEIDNLIKKFVEKDHYVLLHFKSDVEKDSVGAVAKLMGASKSVDHKMANHAMLLEYKKFWFDDSQRQIPKGKEKEYSILGTDDTLKKLASYVPKLVIRRLYNNPNPISVPEIEYYQACVAFADISGFTPLTEKMASMGKEGVEKLTAQLNRYFDMMISNIYRHGGDIIKFAGDAILIMWPAYTKEGLNAAITLASQCCWSLIEELNNYDVPGTGCTLRLHIGIGAGQVGGVYVGNTNKQMEFFISGQTLEQVSSCEKQAQPGEVYVSAVAWMLVKKGMLSGTQKGSGVLANYRLEGIKTSLELPPPIPLPLYKYMEDHIKSYLQPGVLRHLTSIGSKRFLSELRTVSVIFVNLTSPFVDTPTTDPKNNPKLMELHSCVAAMQAIVFKYEGTVRQFMIDDKGSVLIAGFGLPPFAHEDDPARAVETAIEIYQTLQNLKVACSIGVTTGQAFCGDVGTEQRREYAMVGDIVNLSARLMAAAKTGILTDNDTYEKSKNSASLSFDKQEPIKVKGKSNPITVYIPQRKKRSSPIDNSNSNNNNSSVSYSSPSSSSGSSSGSSSNPSYNSNTNKPITKTIIGREEEVKLFQKMIRKLLEMNSSHQNNNKNSISKSVLKRDSGKSRVLIVEGEAGVGKSRLVNEYISIYKQQYYNNNNKSKVFIGHGDQLRNTIPYNTFSMILENSVDKDNNIIQDIYKYIDQSDVDHLPLLNGIIPVTLPENSKLLSMSAQLRSEHTMSLLIKILRCIIPVGSLIILENAQWFDSMSWNLITIMKQQLDGVMIIITARPMKDKTGRVPFHYSQLLHTQHTELIQLQNLTELETGLLIKLTLQMDKVPDDVVREIYKKGQGNPLLIEEITIAMRDSGALQINKSGQCVLSPDFKSASVPSSLQGLITSKVDKMTPSQVLITKVAATVGMVFHPRVILEVLMASGTETSKMPFIKPEDLAKDLKAIKELGIISIESTEPELTLTFSNSLIKDVIYEMMLFAQRRQIHTNIAQYYIDNFPGNSTYYPLLAYHYKQAGMNEDALNYYTKAGSTALNAFSNGEAVTFFTEALQITSEIRQKATLDDITMERKLGQSYYNLGQFDKAQNQFKKALDLMGIPISDDDAKNTRKVTSVRKRIGSHTFSKDKSNNSNDIDPSEKTHRIREAVICLLMLSKVSLYACNKPVFIQCVSLATSIASSTGTALESESYSLSSLAAGVCGDHSMAESQLSKAKELAGRQIDVCKTVDAMAGLYYAGISQWEKSEEYLLKSVTAAKTVGDLKASEESLLYLSTVYYLKGDIKKSVGSAQEALDSSIRRGDGQSQLAAATVQARNYYALGDYVRCISFLEDVKIGFDSMGISDTTTEINFYGLSALVNLRQRKIEQFWFYSEAVYSLLSRLNDPLLCTCFFGYEWVVESYINIIMDVKYLDDGKIPLSKSKLINRTEKALLLLEKFSSVFSFAEPSLLLWRGTLKFLSGKQKDAKAKWSKSSERAQSLGMSFYVAFISHQTALISKNDDAQKKALENFPELQFRTMDMSSIRSKHNDTSSSSSLMSYSLSPTNRTIDFNNNSNSSPDPKRKSIR